jgi:hypothetical protein
MIDIASERVLERDVLLIAWRLVRDESALRVRRNQFEAL